MRSEEIITRSEEKWLGKEMWKDGQKMMYGKMVKRRSVKRWLGKEVWKDG